MKTVVTAGAFDTKGADYGFLVSRIRSPELELLRCPHVFDENQAREMARARADLLVAHAGLTTKGLTGASSTPTAWTGSSGPRPTRGSQPKEPLLSRHAASNRFVACMNRSPLGIAMVEGELT